MPPFQVEAEWLGSLAHTVTPKTVICAHELCKEEGDGGNWEKEKVTLATRFEKEKCKSTILSQSNKLSHVSYWLILILQKNEQEMPIKSMFLSNTHK